VDGLKQSTECAVFSIPAGLADARAVVAVTARAGRTAVITVKMRASGARPTVVTQTPLTRTTTMSTAVHRTHLCTVPNTPPPPFM